MALHKKFPKSPHAILEPSIRWYPGEAQLDARGYGKLLPPLVHKLRIAVAKWRAEGYFGASETSRALLQWWFQNRNNSDGPFGQTQFRYYFAQREAVETVIYCSEVAQVKNCFDFITNYDSSGALSENMFHEDWLRMVVKMATGSGKTKVMSLLIAWSYFHKLYEVDSKLARNFLLITPNIIVLDRIKRDFAGLKIFWDDPVLPDNGHAGQNWRDDFQMRVHLQDKVNVASKIGNIFLTNIHRVYSSNIAAPSADDADTMDYFLGKRPSGATNASKVNLGEIVRDVDEIVVLNDEAHHIHDEKLAWFKTIENISNTMKMNGNALSMQLDFTATPRHNNGAIFVQTVSDYPLVEAIYQNIVKHPRLPDAASRAKLREYPTTSFTEKYKDYIDLGYLEWKGVAKQHEKIGKKAVLFIMTDDTKNCDEVAKYLETTYADFKDATLVIHTKNNGEISEAVTGKKEKELQKLRAAADSIDDWDSPYKAIVSVLMLKEGWDTRNVTTIVGLRAYVAQSNILPEQTLGRGLRRMYAGDDAPEYVSVVGTNAFMDFVETIQDEGVELDEVPMGKGAKSRPPLVIEIDRDDRKKDIAKLDIEIPVLSARLYREYRNIAELDVATLVHKKIIAQEFSANEKRNIHFFDIVSKRHTHTTNLDENFEPSATSVIGFFAHTILENLHLFSGYDVLYGKVKEFVTQHLFHKSVDLDDLNILRNLSEPETTRLIIESFIAGVNALTVTDKGGGEIRGRIKISEMRPFIAKSQKYITPQKSAQNKIIGDGGFELTFAAFLNCCDDIAAFAKNYFAVHFKLDYKAANGELRDYYPDFFVKVSDSEIYIVETKGREDLDDVEKFKRLCQWCEDVNALSDKTKFAALLVRQEDYEKYPPKTFGDLVRRAEQT